jgi:FkbM family methyltransferase
MTRMPALITRGKRILKQLVGKDVWSRVEIAVPCVRLGSEYGGWVVCTSAGLNSESIVYSVGIGDDISFDFAVIERFGCQVVALDPTPQSIAWIESQSLPETLHVHYWGLAGSDGVVPFALPEIAGEISYRSFSGPGTSIQCEVCRLSTIMDRLNHTQLDLLKMDVEGSEYDVIEDLLKSRVRPRQLLVEFHHGKYGIDIRNTRRALALLNAMGYRIFSISPNGREYSFLLSG